MFKDFKASTKALVGLVLSFTGTAWFSGMKLRSHGLSVGRGGAVV